MENIGVFIDHFLPFSSPDIFDRIKEATHEKDRVIVFITNACNRASVQRPWTTEDRKKIITSVLSDKELNRVKFCSIRPYLYDTDVFFGVISNNIDDNFNFLYNLYSKDGMIGFSEIGKNRINYNGSNESCNREVITEYFTSKNPETFLSGNKAGNIIRNFMYSDEYKELAQEYAHIMDYRKMWSNSPFPPIFSTVDAVVVANNHILVIKRGGKYGKGWIALPGGFINANEIVIDGCIRELKEETGLNLSHDKMMKSMIFDHPDRDLRGRTITTAFLFHLGMGIQFPKVKGNDDADCAWWMNYDDFVASEKDIFGDHWDIVRTMFTRK
jgi:bifunctional NMN adenylyltransferase/nudix hydrolase